MFPYQREYMGEVWEWLQLSTFSWKKFVEFFTKKWWLASFHGISTEFPRNFPRNFPRKNHEILLQVKRTPVVCPCLGEGVGAVSRSFISWNFSRKNDGWQVSTEFTRISFYPKMSLFKHIFPKFFLPWKELIVGKFSMTLQTIWNNSLLHLHLC